MRTMLRIELPVEAGNKAIVDGTLAKTIEGFMKEYKPEAAYFLPDTGRRTALFFFDLPDQTYIPIVAERFFLALNADVTMAPAMNIDDLRIGLERAMKARG